MRLPLFSIQENNAPYITGSCDHLSTGREGGNTLKTKRFCQKYVTLMYINPSVIYIGGDL